MPNIDTLLAGLELGPSYAFRDWPNPAVPMLAAGVYTIWRQDELIYVGMAGRSLWARASYRLQLILHVVRPAATTATMQLRAANEGAAMLYSYLVGKLVRQSFDHVNNHRWDELLKPVAPNVHHRFGGSHSIGGERHDKEAMRRWLERLGRVLPNLHLEVNKIWVTGWPWETTVFVQWDATATLLNGDKSYFNRGLHVISMRWGTAYALDVFEDSQEVARGLAAQAAAGLKEAVAEQIGS